MKLQWQIKKNKTLCACLIDDVFAFQKCVLYLCAYSTFTA